MVIMNGSRKVNLYTWHDGYFSDAIKTLMGLPLYLFNAAKHSAEYIQSLRSPDGRLPEDSNIRGTIRTNAPWFYDIMIGNRHEGYESREDVALHWKAMLPMECCDICLANWISWRHFDRWTIVPNLKWCPYPGPDIIIMAERGEYSFGTSPKCDHDDGAYLEEGMEEFTADVEKLNEGMSESAKIRLEKVNKKHFPRVVVPFDEIMIDLMWKDIQERKV